MRLLPLLTLAVLAMPAPLLADDYKVIKLEQDVRNLERQVSELTRQVTALTRQRVPYDGPTPAVVPAEPAAANELWLNSDNWKRLHVGMDELDVLRILGKPASMRADTAESRTLLYAMEIGRSGFLGGNVQLREHRVVAINRPVLK
jgi:hypothetical protein